MSKHQSRQKQRRASRISLEDTVISEVRALASKPFVLAIEDHFAGYFNELGLTITVSDSALDVDVIKLRNKLLELLETLVPTGSSPFTWQVAFTRNSKTIEVLCPDDEERDETDELRAI